MGMRKNFIRKNENFVCEVCGTKVNGTGYTNHCPNCLFSKHVDENIPGDRSDSCHGPMEPIGVGQKHEEYFILHRCQKCGKVNKNKTAEKDNFEKIVELSSNHI